MPTFLTRTARPPSAGTLRLRGLIVAMVLTVGAVFVYQATTGKYVDNFKLTMIANTIGEGLAPGAEVKFHGMAIGSVKELETIGYNKQRMTVLLDPRQAKALTSDTIARFTSSNLFGTTEVELVSEGKGPQLRPNQTLTVRTDVQAATITELLREGQRLSRILDTPELNHVIEVLRNHADLVEPATKAGLDIAKILADSQTMPLSHSLSVLASFLNGLGPVLPALNLAPDLVNSMSFLNAPGGVDRTNLVMHQTGQLLGDVGDIVLRNNPWLIPLMNGTMNAAVPGMYALGSLAPAYDRISGLLDRTSTAFPMVDGDVRMRVEVIMNTAPGIAAALPGPAPDLPGPPPGLPGPPPGGDE
ncbi:MlaD family protein [Mycobacterium bourgelatii]|uniref:Putative Mce family protein n=1 Tax=Mycobacterium bourgelatii TaxID=1273442 RepID=A0A7I9YX52_MYCBU|nr:MlaD family protein [Mycobacterium bourgelatii]MCV6973118.1 MCE family protein [Mycobacterium bourgelatii]GFG93152.1 putative Mce family protein [Mycobacterium bourgelatii]